MLCQVILFTPLHLANAPQNLLFLLPGVVQVYTFPSLALWWLMVTVTLFWKICFPLDLQIREAKKQTKYIHLGFSLVGLLVPLIPVIAVLAHFRVQNPSLSDFVSGGLGFNSVRSPPLACNTASVNLIFYTTILPITFILAVGLTLVLLIFWLIHRVSMYNIGSFMYPAETCTCS